MAFCKNLGIFNLLKKGDLYENMASFSSYFNTLLQTYEQLQRDLVEQRRRRAEEREGSVPHMGSQADMNSSGEYRQEHPD